MKTRLFFFFFLFYLSNGIPNHNKKKKWFCHGCIFVISRIGKARTKKGIKFLAVNIFFCYPFTNSPKKSYYICCSFCMLHQTDYKLFRRFSQKQFSDRNCLDIGDSGVLPLWRAEADFLDRDSWLCTRVANYQTKHLIRF